MAAEADRCLRVRERRLRLMAVAVVVGVRGGGEDAMVAKEVIVVVVQGYWFEASTGGKSKSMRKPKEARL